MLAAGAPSAGAGDDEEEEDDYDFRPAENILPLIASINLEGKVRLCCVFSFIFTSSSAVPGLLGSESFLVTL